ncbi:glycogen synthase [Flavobacterium crassostreae]|uniref:Glycogen synthase n=1 Tax=Flavobacterium crassostreae TaxID=1763534 RepID=A0A1B9DYP1_9FLAO|nr:glycogen synthase [Flavobacterium crassostreae]OCB74811.1 glycogen synthase [Flavobacterium crassostreae]
MDIVHISAECYPVAKVGGLADVVGALPKYQTAAGENVKVVLPAYDTKFKKENSFENVYSGTIQLGEFAYAFDVLKETTNKLGFELYLVALPEFFDRPDIYSYPDDIERFVSFQIATLDWLVSRDNLPDCVHCHDHHTGLIPFLMQYAYKYQALQSIPSIITIHNGLYQGQFGYDKLHYLPEFDLQYVYLLDWDHCINSLAAAIKCAWQITTVSPSYLTQINQQANGLETLFRSMRYKSKGILNGIDTQLWDPNKDSYLKSNYNTQTFEIGKKENKKALCALFNLDPNQPLFSFIGRLYEEKGADLLPQAIAAVLAQMPQEITVLILGSGNPDIEKQLTALEGSYPRNYHTYIGYNEELAHLIYAGSDFLIMPSRVEPCGLNQMYALRYGTMPIVRKTGGLQDTVIDFGDGGNGISHNQASVEDIIYSIQRGAKLYKDTTAFTKILLSGMLEDHSWERVCQEYLALYNLLINP